MNEKENRRIALAYEFGRKKFSPSDLIRLMENAERIWTCAKNLSGLFDEFQILWSLLNDYRTGTYRNIPWKLVAAVGFALTYLMIPLDVIPDFIPVAGYLDDISVFGLVLSGFRSEIESYNLWKKQRTA